MFLLLNHRFCHYLLLLGISSALFLPGLGAPSLWDIDEGNNAECAQEMLGADNWIVPTFNYKLRTDKPAMLYWLQMLAYRQVGVNEFAARLPSALASILAVLLTYEMGRRLYERGAALLAGIVLASAPAFCAAAHFANPDALLNLFTLLTFFLFWRGYVRKSGSWFAWAGISTGLAMLTKGPVGLLLPGAVITLFLAWSGQLKRLLDPRVMLGALTFVLVSGPWYGWVGNDTRWEFLKGFFLKHNLDRFRAPMEGHSGSVFYYLAVLLAGLLLWACFLGPAFWCALREGKVVVKPKANDHDSVVPTSRFASIRSWLTQANPSVRLLISWISIYLVFFSLSRTKLPNYILPVYPAVALILGRFLQLWRRGDIQLPGWVMRTSLSLICLTGLLVSVGLLIAGGDIGGAHLLKGHTLPGLSIWALIGLVPTLGSITIAWLIHKQNRAFALGCLAGTAVLFTGVLAVGPVQAVDVNKAPRSLAGLIHEQHTDPEVRIATCQYFQPSLVFYCRREVTELSSPQQAKDFLEGPLPAYLVVPVRVWNEIETDLAGSWRILGKHADLYRNCEVVLVTNK